MKPHSVGWAFRVSSARGQASPAQLEAILRAKGANVRVVNAGINGDTPKGYHMLAEQVASQVAGVIGR